MSAYGLLFFTRRLPDLTRAVSVDSSEPLSYFRVDVLHDHQAKQRRNLRGRLRSAVVVRRSLVAGSLAAGIPKTRSGIMT